MRSRRCLHKVIKQNLPLNSNSINFFPCLLSAHSLDLNIVKNDPRNQDTLLPVIEPLSKMRIENPKTLKITNNEIISNVKNSYVDPDTSIEKQAARLIVIRKRKMKKHKLKKLRIKMKFEWAKVRQRREMRKEKVFQSELMAKIKEAELFNAPAYAAEKIRKANEVIIPKLWRGKRLPEFVIKDLIKKKEEKKQKHAEDILRRKQINLKASDYKW